MHYEHFCWFQGSPEGEPSGEHRNEKSSFAGSRALRWNPLWRLPPPEEFIHRRNTNMSRTRYKIIEKTGVHFLTCTIVNWLPVLARIEPKEIIIESLRFLQDKARLTVFAYVIMENHLHLITQADNLSAEMGSFKSYTARRIIDFLQEEGNIHYLTELKAYKLSHHKDSTYQLWQEGMHPQFIQGRKMMVQKIEYIHNNPVRRGYVDLPVHWRYSSARNYEEMEGVLEVCKIW